MKANECSKRTGSAVCKQGLTQACTLGQTTLLLARGTIGPRTPWTRPTAHAVLQGPGFITAGQALRPVRVALLAAHEVARHLYQCGNCGRETYRGDQPYKPEMQPHYATRDEQGPRKARALGGWAQLSTWRRWNLVAVFTLCRLSCMMGDHVRLNARVQTGPICMACASSEIAQAHGAFLTRRPSGGQRPLTMVGN